MPHLRQVRALWSVIVGALARPADRLHGHVGVVENALIADQAASAMLMFLDPIAEAEGL